MPDVTTSISSHIPNVIANERWEKSLSLFEISVQMLRDNPTLPKRSGQRIAEFMMPIQDVQQLHQNDLS